MIVLMDTHSFLWFVNGSSRLSARARAIIEDPENDKLLSMASIWEMAIKISLGKLAIAQPFEQFIPQQLQINGFEMFEVKFGHIAKTIHLPFHHRDPFDRLLIAQSLVEQLPIVGMDSVFDSYSVQRLW
ncbi:twitching motility protein PilT [candidate division KSB1 bacterium RBG_16_48_16]|nr:MAG: twitching motility protein PilT [candidate division KSB1 bacterium RBG_16_48_16]